MKIIKPVNMKKSVYKSGMLLLAGILLLASGLSAQTEVTKDFRKEYKARQGMTLDLNNRYGEIIVETSESDKVEISVKATVRFPNKERAERLLSYIDVQFAESGDVISAKPLSTTNSASRDGVVNPGNS